MNFLLGTHMPSWLARTDVPLFVSHRRLMGRKSFPRALGPWALDSGGFTELNMHGGWVTTAPDYVAAVERYSDQIGNLAWAAPQDWMCEPTVLAKTGLTVADHQRLTVDNYVELRSTGLPFVPVLQGWAVDDYLRCVDRYDRAGIDLTAEPLVGLGTVCRRQNTGALVAIVTALDDLGIPLHAFGVKLTGLRRIAYALASADSMAWSFRGRRGGTCGGTHRSCANCLPFALSWRESVLRAQLNQQPHLGAAA